MARIPKLITILGPTACGKSALGIALAQEFNGEIVSADSRQVYRGLDIGTGKVTAEEQALVPHHLLDVMEPPTTPSPSLGRLGTSSRAGGDILFSVADYQQLAFTAIDNIIKRHRLPFLVGGTALYIYAVIDNYQFAHAGPNLARRRELEKKSVEELIVIASEALAKRSNLNNVPSDDGIASVGRQIGDLLRNDIKNPRRLIRAIEKLEAGGRLAPKKGPPRYDNLILGIDLPRAELYARIDQRVDARVQQGMIEEVQKLRKYPLLSKSLPRAEPGKGAGRRPVSRSETKAGGGAGGGAKIDNWLLGLGLEYRFITEYLRGQWPSQEAMISRLKTAIHAFARRQLTWWRHDRRIVWIKDKDEARSAISTEASK